jgi:L-fuconolactonase
VGQSSSGSATKFTTSQIPSGYFATTSKAESKRFGKAGLTYDLLVRPRELAAAVETARLHPDVSFVIDHLAKPRVRLGREDREWADALARLATRENVACKLSGLVTEARWDSWNVSDLVPYVRHALARFGEQRLLFGSDWPVCLLACSYEQVFDTYRGAVGPVSHDVRTRIFGLNAVDCYRLDAR